MGKRFIINGDDLGLSPAYDYGMMYAYDNGILSSATLMSNMDAAPLGVELAKKHGLHLGLHTNIVQGHCCADPTTIPSIVHPDGFFYRSGEYKKHYKDIRYNQDDTTGVEADEQDYKREARAQIEQFKELTGAYPIHIEGHSIISPELTLGLQDVAHEYGCHVMRFDMESQPGYRDCSELMADQNVMRSMKDYMKEGMTVAMLLEVLEAMKANPCDINVLHLHPGWVDATVIDFSTLTIQRCRDIEALCDDRVKQWINDNDIMLISFDDLKIN